MADSSSSTSEISGHGSMLSYRAATTLDLAASDHPVEKERSSQSPAVPNSVPVGVAYELIQAGHRYLDVRTNEEFDSGHVVGAVNVPFMLRTGSDMARNPKFLEQVLDQFGKDDEIVVGCQIGKRSLMASSELTSSGFTAITDMGGGYAAWVQNGLPTTMSQ